MLAPCFGREPQESKSVSACRAILVGPETRILDCSQQAEALESKSRCRKQTEEARVKRTEVDGAEVAQHNGLAGKNLILDKGVPAVVEMNEFHFSSAALFARGNFSQFQGPVANRTLRFLHTDEIPYSCGDLTAGGGSRHRLLRFQSSNPATGIDRPPVAAAVPPTNLLLPTRKSLWTSIQ